MKCVIIGYGYMGEIRKKVIDDTPQLKLTAICDSFFTQEKISANCEFYRSYRDAIDKEHPDIVFVCTPNSVSPAICVYALNKGCHVFCEKPPGRNLNDIKHIIDAEKDNPGLRVMFGFNHRHHPAVIEAKSIADSNRLGKILWLRGIYGKSGGYGRKFEETWRNDPIISGGGILLDQGIHMLDLFRFFCGDFTEISSMITTSHWNIPVEDNAFVLLQNDQGQIAQLHSSATLWKHTFQLDIGFEYGYVKIKGLLSKTGSYGREHLVVGYRDVEKKKAAAGNPREEILFFDTDLSWKRQVINLVNCIQSDSPVKDSSTDDAFCVMKIIDKVYHQHNIKSDFRTENRRFKVLN